MTVWRRNWEPVNEKLIGLLGIARRAGRLQTGFDATVAAVSGGDAQLALCASNLSEKTRKEWRFATKDALPLTSLPLDKAALAQALGLRKPVGLVAVCDEGFARAMRAHIPDTKEEQTI